MKERKVHRPHVDTARPHETILVAAERMRRRNVGTLVGVDEEQRPVGTVTDRDLVTRAARLRGDLCR